MVKKESEIRKLVEFRDRMSAKTTISDVMDIFGNKLNPGQARRIGVSTRQGNRALVDEKLDVAFNNRTALFVSDWVRYIGVTGSVASGFANEDDDIDVFVVVKNGYSWLYRGFMLFKSMDVRRKVGSQNISNLFCVNIIAEERGLKFEPDFFNFHDLYYMKTLFNSGYKNVILNKNKWVREFGGVLPQSVLGYKAKSSNIFISIVNFLAFLAQLIYMILFNHKPEIKRLFTNNMQGRIEFFGKNFKDQKLKEFKSTI